jgi:flagellar capping protein FliD
MKQLVNKYNEFIDKLKEPEEELLKKKLTDNKGMHMGGKGLGNFIKHYSER